MAHLRLRWQAGLALGFAASVLVLLWSRTTLGGAGDVVIAFPTPFSSLDGSGQDFDNAANGVFTVQGDLTITSGGSITCNDDLPLPPNADACPIGVNVAGNLTIERGGSITAENRRSGGSGGDIFLNVGSDLSHVSGDLSLQAAGGGLPGGIISAGKLSGAGDTGISGDVAIRATGDVSVDEGAQVLANAGGEAGAIEIAGWNVSLDGRVSAAGGTTVGRGGPIKVIASSDLTISDNGVVTSRGQGPGADLVHLQGCGVTINGLVESTGPGHQNAMGKNLCNDPPRPGHPANSTACLEVWSGTTITLDSRAPHNGELNADTALSGGTQGRGWIELVSTSDVLILGDSSGAFAVHANQPNLTNGQGGQIGVFSPLGGLEATGRAFQADATPAGGDGGQITLESFWIGLGADIYARGDFSPIGGFGKGGTIIARAGLGQLVATGIGDVRPTGYGVIPNTDPTADPQRGNGTLTACTSFCFCSDPPPQPAIFFPSIGTPTTPHGGSGPPFCFGPGVPSYVELPPLEGDGFGTLTSCNGTPIRVYPTSTPNRVIVFENRPTPTPTPNRRAPLDRVHS